MAPVSAAAWDYDVCIIGGAGHVGLPLGLVFADKGQRVVIYDLNRTVLETIASGHMPFTEHGAQPLLDDALASGRLHLSTNVEDISRAQFLIVAIGTPVDEYLNPKLRPLLELFAGIRKHLRRGQTIVIRSSVFPRTCRQVASVLAAEGGEVRDVAYCPERIAQGYAVRELKDLPQIISGTSEEAVRSASALFALVSPKIITLEIEEAELAKLFSNAWRYIQFAVANQFYMISETIGLDFDRVRHAMVEGYGRASSLPSAGFAAGPCLLKDTLQLAAFNNNNFLLGHAAMMVNEGLPGFIVDGLRRHYDLSKTRVGILGMAFKADVDDTRDSLSYKLGKLLRFHGADVLYSDEFARDSTFVAKEHLVASVDVVIVGVAHSAYKTLAIPAGVHVVDLWSVVCR